MYLVQLKNIVKRFPGVLALNNVNFSLKQGEIVSLLGENGAGKTTLMNVLYGMFRPDDGEVIIDGTSMVFRSPMAAIKAGISMVHQHFMLVPAFSVTENIIVGMEPVKIGLVDFRQARENVRALIEKFGFNLDPDALVRDLSVGQQQRVEILKTLYREARVIILDEPTAVLTPQEVSELFAVLKTLQENGKSIIIITHKLRETFALADRVVVLRNGVLVADNINPRNVTSTELSTLMVGSDIDLQENDDHEINIENDLRLKVENLTVSVDTIPVCNNVSFGINAGEIVGIAGVEGNGQTQLAQLLSGYLEPDEGEIFLDGLRVTGGCSDFMSAGVGLISEDRQKYSLIADMTVGQNLILGYHASAAYSSKRGILNHRKIDTFANKACSTFDIRTSSIYSQVSTLSGGNQQKVVAARVFSQSLKLLIAAQPTRGVDIGATQFIHKKIFDLRNKHVAILLISADLDEVIKLSDRILVMYEGKIVSNTRAGELTREELGLRMTGSIIDIH